MLFGRLPSTFLVTILLGAGVLCSCANPYEANTQLAHELETKNTTIQNMEQANANLKRDLDKSQHAVLALQATVGAFSLESDDLKPYSLDDGLISTADAIIGFLTNHLSDTASKNVSVGHITFAGRKRIQDAPEMKWEPASSKPIYESMDNLGVYIEQVLRNRLTEHNVIRIENPPLVIIEGSYLPDTRTSFKLLLHLRKPNTSGLFASVTRTIKKDGIIPVYLHLINQFDDSEE